MKDERDPPVIEQTFIGGVNVVDIGDVRVARGFSRRHHSSCPHRQLVYDGQERRIWCKDCEKDVEGFDAFKLLVEYFDTASAALERRRREVEEAEAASLISRAAKAVDEVWRGRKRLPSCLRCGQGLFPEDFAGGVRSTVGRDYAEAARRKAREGATR